jgi:hypothetical protein
MPDSSIRTDLAKQDNFQTLFHLLKTFPSLTQLHLVGTNFFGVVLSADALSRIPDDQICFTYPLLAALLSYLVKTNVKIFSYENAGRALRWTRLSKIDDFEKDCWTL